ncbi:hypothetical protein DP939_04370 [Spongiactinospora rosea]|uniref:Uncharacterized protein n=2 Tax=Spongiactinospora rosea TaxID=2248750 RepID=A0A366M8W7_9ACTN|nr:hypothetical protein DP939_04370 [Spongiactinospora rosea]
MLAETAMYALSRAEACGMDKVSGDMSRFRLRMLIITDLGPNGDPEWDPDVLGADILHVLPLDREQAATWSLNWEERPISEIRSLRHCKNLLSSAKMLRPHLTDPTIITELDQWLTVREHLP